MPPTVLHPEDEYVAVKDGRIVRTFKSVPAAMFFQMVNSKYSVMTRKEYEESRSSESVRKSMTNAQKLVEALLEGDSIDSVKQAITRRIMFKHPELLGEYGPEAVTDAIEQVANFYGGTELEEIGTSDVSIWVQAVIRDLESGRPDADGGEDSSPTPSGNGKETPYDGAWPGGQDQPQF